MNFQSDNIAGAAPEVLAALDKAATGAAAAYGADAWSARAAAMLREAFETEAQVFLVATGTGANSIALAAMGPPWGAVLCHEEAHIAVAEGGAPEFFSGGAKLSLLPGAHGKIAETALTARLSAPQRGVHASPFTALSLTQATERGSAYSVEELSRLSAHAHAHGLGVHMDGARFANAAAHFGASPATLSWRAGIDVLSLGFTKTGAFAAEAIVVFDQAAAENIERVRKRGGHLISKQRFIAAQVCALLEDGLWLRLAARANALAQRIAAAAGAWLAGPCASNVVILRAPAPIFAALRAQGFLFHDWAEGEARLVCAFNTEERDVDQLCQALSALS